MLLPSMMEVSMPYARTHIVNRAVEFPSLPRTSTAKISRKLKKIA
jgi:hypothetical protein